MKNVSSLMTTTMMIWQPYNNPILTWPETFFLVFGGQQGLSFVRRHLAKKFSFENMTCYRYSRLSIPHKVNVSDLLIYFEIWHVFHFHLKEMGKVILGLQLNSLKALKSLDEQIFVNLSR